MKTIGVLLASLLFANLALADEATIETDAKLTLAARTPKAIDIQPVELKQATPEMKIIDVDLNDKLKSLNETISNKLEEKFNERMQLELEDI